jgi:putative ABC transport system ATP-binding protein
LKIRLFNLKPKSFEFKKSEETIWGHDIILESGKIYQILASSGSGKSTFVSILAGLRGDYDGDVIIGDKKMSQFNTNDWSKWRSSDISFVFQELRLFPELTVKDNVDILKEINKDFNSSENKTIQQYLEIFGIGQKTDVKSKFLSYGQQQRVAIIRSISRNYQWLILDEPFSHLDDKNAQLAWQIITDDAKMKNAGIIITSLDPYSFISPNKKFIL